MFLSKLITTKVIRFVILILAVSLLIMGGRVLTADATPSDLVWDDVTGAKIQVVENSGAPWKSWYMPHCQSTSALVMYEDYKLHGAITFSDVREVCYVDSGHVQLGVFQKDGEAHYAIRYDGDNTFHQILGFNQSWIRATLLSDDTLIAAYGAPGAIPNVQLAIKEVSPGRSVYTLDLPHEDQDLLADIWASNIAVSKNEHFAIVQMPGFGLARIDLRTREMKLIFDDKHSDHDDNRYDLLAISNDGNSATITGNDSIVHRIYTDIDDCGVSSFEDVPWERTANCHFIDFADEIAPQLARGTLYNPEFSDDGRTFMVHVWDNVEQKPQEVVLAPDPESPRLDYLALGDSYTSGEGDIGRDASGKKYYLPGTTLWPNDCHLSSRSYPYLLRNDWGMASDRMKSVACSGAQVMPDYNGNPINYRGQENRLSDRPDISTAKQQALKNFTPGHTTQLEFVKKYQPKIVTFTGGGNDVGFADILKYCLEPPYSDSNPWMALFTFADCDYAVKDSELNKILLRTIDTQYGYTKKLIQDIQTTSPTTKIVLVGYPSFVVSNASLLCTPSAGFLSGAEATMMNDMVDRMNSMLRRAAHDTGITYVDITHALDGGRICEGSKYMTDVWKNIVGEAAEEERFHPNAQGHQRIANVIQQANINTPDDDVPSVGTYEPSNEPGSAIQVRMVDNGITVKALGLTIHIDPGMFMPNSIFKSIIYSTPTQLGTFTTDFDGSATLHLPLDGIGIGRHVLVMDGVDANGDPTQLYQFIEVKASENDADGDGISDEDDPCQYIVVWYDETTGENICDPSPTLALGGYDAKGKLTSANNVSHDDSWDLALAGYFSGLSEPVKGATITSKPTTKNGQSASTNGITISIVAVVLLGTVGGAIYVYRKIKQS